jgi:hypothetical protein
MKFNKLVFGILLLIVSAGFSNSAKVKKLPEIERGTLLLRTHPKSLDAFIANGKINMTHVFSVCNFLTDNDSLHYNGYVIPERKKAFARHIKHLYARLAQASADNKAVDNELMEIFYELALFSESLKQKTIANANPDVSFSAKVDMFRDSRRSRKTFQFKNEITDHEAVNINPANLQEDPADSPFWHNEIAGVAPDERFDHLARLKKVKPTKNMIVIFEEPSLSGSAPKIDVKDIDLDNGWSLKWGDEVHTDPVGSHIFAALGYDVDHPYYYGLNEVTLVFDGTQLIKNAEQLKAEIKRIYNIDLAPFISYSGIISPELIVTETELKSFSGKQFVRFKECSLEARPDRVKRIGSFVPYLLSNEDRRELRGALLAHAFIGNWDTRETNTLLTSVHMGNYNYRMSAVFSDLGTSFGVSYGIMPADFKVGLVNEFPWEVATNKNGVVHLNNPMNAILPCYEKATYNDLLWMAKKIAAIDGEMLRSMVAAGHWPKPIATLYYQKLASRRASILKAFNLEDAHPIAFNRKLDLNIGEVEIIKDGKLLVDSEKNKNPVSFLSTKGRFRNYGN